MGTPIEISKCKKRLFPVLDTSASSVLIYDGGIPEFDAGRFAEIANWFLVKEMAGAYLFFYRVIGVLHVEVVLSVSRRPRVRRLPLRHRFLGPSAEIGVEAVEKLPIIVEVNLRIARDPGASCFVIVYP